MESSDVIDALTEALTVLLQVSGPIMLVSLVVGLTIALFQALTQIQEVTLTFVPKIFAVFISLLFLGPFIVAVMQTFMQVIADRIISLGG
ncbi:MAG: flagellar biosynthesis protein FliQ [Alphaproteobacteria bacterium]|nr:flagellar biosynthesis protein FliQ [Alphaproteobacteria bacterium SS10]